MKNGNVGMNQYASDVSYNGGGGEYMFCLLKTRLYADFVKNCPNYMDRHVSVVGP